MEFLMFGTFWFWLLLTIAAGVIIFAVEAKDDGGIGATIALAVTVGLLFWLGPRQEIKDFFSFVVHNPLVVLLFFSIYVVAGTVWSVVKWWIYLKEEATRVKNGGYYYGRPKAKDEKARILGWMFYWPFSGLWTLINNPVKRAFKAMFNYLEETYDRMSARIFKDFDAAKAEAEEKERERYASSRKKS